MRLIDADKLMRSIRIADKQDVLGLRDLIQNEDTVIAIPWKEICNILYNRPDDHAQIRLMLYMWLEENSSEFREEINRWWAEHSSPFD